MAVEFEFFTMRSDSRHNSLCRRLPGFEGRGGEDAADDHARVRVPWLRLKAQLDRDAVLACLAEQVVEFAERPDGKRAARFQEHFEYTNPLPHPSGCRSYGDPQPAL